MTSVEKIILPPQNFTIIGVVKFLNTGNALTDIESTTYASASISSSNTNNIVVGLSNFDFSGVEIPTHATSVTIAMKVKTTCTGYRGITAVATDRPKGTRIKEIKGYDGVPPKDWIVDYSGINIDVDTLKRYARGFTLQITYTPDTSYNQSRTIQIYGAEIDIQYETNPLYVRDEFLWNQQAKLYIKNRGAWDFYVPSFDLFDHNKLILPGIIRTAN